MYVAKKKPLILTTNQIMILMAVLNLNTVRNEKEFQSRNGRLSKSRKIGPRRIAMTLTIAVV